MSRLPDAGDSLEELPLACIETPPTWVRINRNDFPSAEFYSRDPDNRFTSPNNSFGVMCLAESEKGAIAETICRNAARKKAAEKFVTWETLTTRGLYEFSFNGRPQVLDFTVGNLARYRLDDRISCERKDGRIPPYEFGPAWAEHAWDLGLAGIRYWSRHARVRCLAVFEGRVTVTGETHRCNLNDDALIAIIEDEFDWAIKI